MSGASAALGPISTRAATPAVWGGWLYRICLTATICTYLLIVAGATVRVTGSGLGCPDWPTCHGRLVPPLETTALIEYTHRFLGAITSALILAVPAVALLARREWRFMTPALALPVLLALQIALGALVVRLELDPLAVLIHLGFALLILGGMIWLTIAETPALGAVAERQRGRSLTPLLTAFTALTFALVLTGGITRATGASWACRGFPGCDVPSEALAAMGEARTLVTIHHAHRGMAYVTAVLGLIVSVVVWRARGGALRMASLGLAAALAAQVTIGALAVSTGLPAVLRGAHVGGAAAVWAAAVSLVAFEAHAQFGRRRE